MFIVYLMYYYLSYVIPIFIFFLIFLHTPPILKMYATKPADKICF